MTPRFRVIFAFIGIFLLFNSYTASAQEAYNRNIDSAMKAFDSQHYLQAAQFYSKAFASNNDRGVVIHRYNAARSWALAGLADSAFYQLNRIIKAGYFQELGKIKIDNAFTNLRTDARWAQLVNVVQANGINFQTRPIKEPNLLLVALLDTIKKDDQLYRNSQLVAIQKYGYTSPEAKRQTLLMLQHDSLNQQKIARLFNQYGWPDLETIGSAGNQTIFLVLQHSGLTVRLKYLNLINDALKRGQINSSEMALFTDRTDLMQGKKQTYGTQVITDSQTGKSYVQPLIDPEHVNERRASMGLQAMEYYVKQWNINWSINQYYKDLPIAQSLTNIQ